MGDGKKAKDESFPVAMSVLPAEKRRHVAAFYAFARAADDVADDPTLGESDKLNALDAMEAVLTGAIEPEEGQRGAALLRKTLAQTGIDPQCARDLIAAFRIDASNTPMETWNDLLNYCSLSAAPVGRFLLALFGEHDPLAIKASDSLCAALQVENHLQDCRSDFQQLGRIYLPEQWFREMAVRPDALGKPMAQGQIRALLDRALDGVDQLLIEALALPGSISNRRLRIQAATTLSCAERLAMRLRDNDPLADHVGLSRWDWAVSILRGLLAGATR
ncbi:MAG: squalene/phytoene synthase family protein [Rhodospirillales bacterium]|nr:squalene/phytoene synthase family protein [Rhodospirillales bacterium]MCW8861536.1 squalene/phytoene synthase family protein [Rhodospirillales bacterium]MCW8951316.1 squalene/phytoene synthase family protein [Rhodospirillales bacterium]MCW8971144.1 squalene/phytoene synthase family protein [Rhodospirillales bacterium]MCW9001655.1 squalene/phytoene synthase family protein [Rhodospirillales bacterium]